MLFPILPIYFQHLNFSPSLIGIMVSIFSMISIPLAIPIGKLMDKYSPIKGVRIGFCMNLISSILLIVFKNISGIIISQLLGGLGFLLIVVGSQAKISLIKEYSKKARFFGKLSLFAAMGQGAGPWLGGWIVEQFDFNVLFLLTAIISVPGIFLQEPKNLKKKKEKEKKYISLREEILYFLKNKEIFFILIFSATAVFVTSLRSSFFPIFLKENSYPAQEIGLFISIFSIIMSFVRIFVGKLFKLVSPKNLMGITLLFFSMGFLIIPLRTDVVTLLTGIVMWGIGFGISQPLSMLLISENIKKDSSGIGMGVRFTAITISGSTAPVIFGLITQYMDIKYNFYLASLICLTLFSVLTIQRYKTK